MGRTTDSALSPCCGGEKRVKLAEVMIVQLFCWGMLLSKQLEGEILTFRSWKSSAYDRGVTKDTFVFYLLIPLQCLPWQSLMLNLLKFTLTVVSFFGTFKGRIPYLWKLLQNQLLTW